MALCANYQVSAKKAWQDIWGCGQGIGAVHDVVLAPSGWRCADRPRVDADAARTLRRLLDPRPVGAPGSLYRGEPAGAVNESAAY